MITNVKYRNSKGQFTAFTTTKKLTKEIYDDENTKIGAFTKRWTSKNSGKTSLVVKVAGREIKTQVGAPYTDAAIFEQGVKLFNLKSESVLREQDLELTKEILSGEEFNEEEIAEQTRGQYIRTGFPVPARRYRLHYEGYNISIEEPYFWVLHYLRYFSGFPT